MTLNRIEESQTLATNSSTTALDNGQTYTGEWTDVSAFESLVVGVKTDQDGDLYIDFSNDQSNADGTLPVIPYVVNEINPPQRITVTRRYFRVRFTNNSGSNQTYFRLSTMLGHQNHLTSPLNGKIARTFGATVTRSISEEEVLRGRIEGEYIISKFGHNLDIDAAEDIDSAGGDYAGFPTTAAEEFQVGSSDAADAAAGTGARTVRCWYLDDNYNMFDSAGDMLTFDVTLNGVTYVDSGITGTRIWRTKVLTSGSGQTNAGVITPRWKTTTSAQFASIPIGYGQSQFAGFTIPAGYTGYIRRVYAEMNDNTTNYGTLAIKYRDTGSNTFILSRPVNLTTDKNVSKQYYGGPSFAAKTDLIYRMTSINNLNGDVTVDFGLLLVKN